MKEVSFSSAVLKNIAYLTMLTDHFFAVVFTEVIQRHSLAGYRTDWMNSCYSVGRAIGRVSFILFCYLVVESFMHTRSRKKYLLRLGGFALVSEIPFDLAFSGKVVDCNSQNVFFTLFIGVFILVVWEWAGKSVRMLRICNNSNDAGWHICITVFEILRIGIVPAGGVVAYYLKTDYRYMGVFLIFIFYLFHERGIFAKMIVAGCVMFLGTWSTNCLRYADIYAASYLFRFSMREMYGLFAFVPIFLYDGSKGRQLPKAVYYGFYPVHLLVLHGIACLI
ncbi:MAG: conjugal transfer protein TraX [Lachnospiraceae bacterium]|nr:conjugal transfer protein TraX [Lachnospiraceae bacterium]